MVFFNFFIGLSQSHYLTYEYDELIQVGLCLFIPFSCIFFGSLCVIDFFFRISFFNIWFVEN
jgi:hypothetical protein